MFTHHLLCMLWAGPAAIEVPWEGDRQVRRLSTG